MSRDGHRALSLGVTGAATFGALAAGDVLAGGAGSVLAVVWAASCGAALGLLFGLVAGGWTRLLDRLSPRRRWLSWLAVAVGCAGWLVYSLDALGQLAGGQRGAAVVAVVAALLSGAAIMIGAVLLVRLPVGGAQLSRRAERAGFAMAAAGAVVCVAIDRWLFIGRYEAAHLALRGVALWLAFVLTTRALTPVLHNRGRRFGALAVAAVLALAAPLTVRSHHTFEIDHIVRAPLARVSLGALRALADFDFDGHSAWLGGGDCSPFDSAVHPGAAEIAANGVDDNCRLGDAEAQQPRAASPPTEPVERSAILITIDTVRASSTSLYGGPATTPELERWAGVHAIVFERAFSSSNRTTLTLPTLMRGVYARRLEWHRVRRTDDGQFVPAGGGRFSVRAQSAWAAPLAARLQAAGVTTAAFVDDGRSGELEPGLGHGDGFDRYDLARPGESDAEVVARAVDYVRSAPAPFFVWVHLYGPHAPNQRHAGAPEFGSGQLAGYHHDIAATDRHLGTLLRATGELPAAPAIVVTSDHGESIRSGYRMHGGSLDRELTQVPLAIAVPGRNPGRSATLASTVDIAPTVLALVGAAPAPGLDGVDLFGAPCPARAVISDAVYWNVRGAVHNDLAAATDGRVQLVLDLRRGDIGYHRLGDETHPLPRDATARALTAQLYDYLERAGPITLR